MKSNSNINFDDLLKYAFGEMSESKIEEIEEQLFDDLESTDVLEGIYAYAFSAKIGSVKAYKESMRKEQNTAVGKYERTLSEGNKEVKANGRRKILILTIALLLGIGMAVFFLTNESNTEQLKETPKIDFTAIYNEQLNLPKEDILKTLMSFYQIEKGAMTVAGEQKIGDWRASFKAGDFVNARQILDEQKQVTQFEFYMAGMLHLLCRDGNIDLAVQNLEKGRGVRNPFNAQYSGYLLAYITIGDIEKAKAEFIKNPAFNTFYSEELIGRLEL